MNKQVHRRRSFQLVVLFLSLVGILYYYIVIDCNNMMPEDKSQKLKSINEKAFERLESIIKEALREEKGQGCNLIDLNPFSDEVKQFDKKMPPIVCEGQDWVKCHLSKCKVVDAILRSMVNIKCIYEDLIFVNDDKQYLGNKSLVRGSKTYELIKSDHIRVSCIGKLKHNKYFQKAWSGYCVGFRRLKPLTPSRGRETGINVMILALDSTSKNGFIRHLPLSYKVLTDDLKAVIMHGYNTVDVGTPGALFPILTGRSEIELPNVRRNISKEHLDNFPFIFHALKDNGYRTAYLEDMPNIGTFQYRYNGFLKQPADHYIRPLLVVKRFDLRKKKARQLNQNYYCFGDTPQHEVMLNISKQFFELKSKKYCFTFIADVTHDDFNMACEADADVVEFLKYFKSNGHLKNTLLIVMGDHGPRYGTVRQTYVGKLEERLPFMAIILPRNLLRKRPYSLNSLKKNAHTLTTPFDIYTTILDAIGMEQLKNPYKVPGADYPRGLSLLNTIPKSRSCSEAGIEPFWCTCVQWKNVSQSDVVYKRAAEALVAHINGLTQEYRSMCEIRTLWSIPWVLRRVIKTEATMFAIKKTEGDFKQHTEYIQVKVVLEPGRSVFEAPMIWKINSTDFVINTRDISRVNSYAHESDCLSSKDSYLNSFCYCINYKDGTGE